MEIVQLTQNLVSTTATLYGEVFSEPPWNETWTVEATLQAVKNPLLRWWVAVEDNQVIGFVAGCAGPTSELEMEFKIPPKTLIGDKVGYLAELGVTPALRRYGLARQLTTEILTHFRKDRIDGFAVRTRPGTGNYLWYLGRLEILHPYPDGRTLFGCSGLPSL